MVNFGPLAAEIVSLVWGTPDNFNGFRVLVALLHVTLVVGVSQTAALNRGRHLYSAGRPSRWALAHILVVYLSHTNVRTYENWKQQNVISERIKNRTPRTEFRTVQTIQLNEPPQIKGLHTES